MLFLKPREDLGFLQHALGDAAAWGGTKARVSGRAWGVAGLQPLLLRKKEILYIFNFPCQWQALNSAAAPRGTDGLLHAACTRLRCLDAIGAPVYCYCGNNIMVWIKMYSYKHGSGGTFNPNCARGALGQRVGQ